MRVRQTGGVGLFGGRRAKAQEWHGRSAELADAGLYPWQVLWEALAIAHPAEGGGAMAPLGLRGLRVGFKNDPTSVYHGERHGRWVQVRQAEAGRGRMQMIVWVGAVLPSFDVVADHGRLVGQNAPPLIAAQSPSDVWQDMECRAGSSGIVARRTVKATQSQGWLYDLWLAEALAVGAPSQPAFAGDPVDWQLPI